MRPQPGPPFSSHFQILFPPLGHVGQPDFGTSNCRASVLGDASVLWWQRPVQVPSGADPAHLPVSPEVLRCGVTEHTAHTGPGEHPVVLTDRATGAGPGPEGPAQAMATEALSGQVEKDSSELRHFWKQFLSWAELCPPKSVC